MVLVYCVFNFFLSKKICIYCASHCGTNGDFSYDLRSILLCFRKGKFLKPHVQNGPQLITMEMNIGMENSVKMFSKTSKKKHKFWLYCNCCEFRSKKVTTLQKHYQYHTFNFHYKRMRNPIPDRTYFSSLCKCHYCSYCDKDFKTILYHVENNHKTIVNDFRTDTLDNIRKQMKNINKMYFEQPMALTMPQEKCSSNRLSVSSQLSGYNESIVSSNASNVSLRGPSEDISETDQDIYMQEASFELKKVLEKHFPRFKCLVCSTTFVSSDALKQHLKQSRHRDLISCPKCKCSNSSRNLDQRAKYNRNYISYWCINCEFEFKINNDSEVQLGHSTFCIRCNRHFGTTSSLVDHLNSIGHLRLHYKCECKLAFMTKDLLKEHVRSTRHKPVHCNCSQCQQACELQQSMNHPRVANNHINSTDQKSGVEKEPSVSELKFTQKEPPENYIETSEYKIAKIDPFEREFNFIKSTTNTKDVENEYFSVDESILYSVFQKEIPKKISLNDHIESSEHKLDITNICSGSKLVKFSCFICKEEFDNKNSLDDHRMHSAHGEYNLICLVCKKEFANENALENHFNSTGHNCSDSKLRVANKDALNKNTMVVCSIWRKKFGTKNSLDNHIRSTDHRMIPFVCSFCKREFVTENALCNHIKSTGHKLGMKNIRSSLKQHSKNIAKSGRMFECSCCRKEFYEQSSVDNHIKSTGHGVVPFVCSFCEKEFVTQNALCNHIKSTGHKPEMKNFPPSLNLGPAKRESMNKNSKNTANSERIFECSCCRKEFDMQSSLYNHIKSTGHSVVPFVCSFCKKEFVTENALCNHIKSTGHKLGLKHIRSGLNLGSAKREPLIKNSKNIANSERKFECSGCRKKFDKQSSLDNHIKSTVHSIVPFVCSFCKKEFVTKNSLCNHIRSTGHTIEVEKYWF